MYYLLDGLKHVGPFSIEQLKSRGITPDSMVFSETFNDKSWRQARHVPELASIFGPYSAPSIDYGPTGSLLQNPIPYSGFGIASFALGLVTCIALFAMFVGGAMLVAEDPDGLDEESPIAMGLGAGICGSGLANLLGVVFGIIGLTTRDRRQVFSYLGIAINCLPVLGIIGLLIIGLFVG